MHKESNQSLRLGFRRLQKWDRWIESMLRHLRLLFRHGTWQGCLLEAFEPAVSGAVVALAYLVLDALVGKSDTHFYHFANKALFDPKLIGFAALAAAVALALTGSAFGAFWRRFVVSPLFQFTHHLVMLAWGIFIVLAAKDLPTEFSYALLAKSIFVLVFLPGIGVVLYAFLKLLESRLVARLEAYRTARWIFTALGFVLFAVSLYVLRDLLPASPQPIGHSGQVAPPATGASVPK